ncbi:hypothetical protein BKA70DRAFT_1274948 [Coprinopsis sp. MPI-PUGE-AT-0042]|nr:hypothetical protein BKA70DRAFT_1274948 [Coprinopsis sp. MPI-PUGE-AT-0042]
MKLQIAYRIPRKVSDWVLEGYYSEVVVEGQENVPKDGPLIVAATHPNEIIDIATLAVTIPHRESRFLCFWAKSGLFKNPLVNAFIRSSGAIPVKRNLNKTSSEDMSARLREGGVVGLFPEGGSYTGWKIFQVMPGAAWSGVEYTLTAGEGEEPVIIVPTAITYTDKSRYGEPIRLKTYRAQLVDPTLDKQTVAIKVAKEVTSVLEQRLQDMAVNAPDWETICAVKAAKQIIFLDQDKIPLSQWVHLDQWLVENLNEPGSAEPSMALIRLVAFAPPLLLYLPGYASAFLATKVLAHPAEEEAHAQFRAVVGGLGIGAHIAGILLILWNSPYAPSIVRRTIFGQNWASNKWQQVAHGLAASYLCMRILSKWHKLLFKRVLQNVSTCWKVLKSQFLVSELHPSKVEAYTTPVYPPIPRWIKGDIPRKADQRPPPVDPAKLVPTLLQARKEATVVLRRHLARAKANRTLPTILQDAVQE